MSMPAWSDDRNATRRARRAALRPALSVVAAAASAVVPVVPAPRTAVRKGRGIPLLAALAVIALHVGVVLYLRHRPIDASKAPVPPAPIPVTLVQPQVIQPPAPLPQKKQALPPRPPPPSHAPPIERPAPVPTPAPAVTPATPVVQAPPVPVPPPPAAPADVPVTPAVGYAGYLNNPAPDYPQFAQEQGWEGHIVLHVHVLADGHPDDVQVKISSHRKVLDEAAQRAVRHWLFSPARRGSTATDGWVDVPIDFKLSS